LKSAVAARRTNLRSVSISGPADTLRGPAARLLKLFIELPEARQALGPSLGDEDLAGSDVERIWRVAKDMAVEGEMSYGRLGSRLADPADQDLLLRLASMPGPVANLCEAEECVRRLREGRLARRLQELQQKLESAADGAAVDDLLRQKMDLRREIHALRSAPAS